MKKNPASEPFFCLCETCGGIEFVEQSQISGKEFNELLPNGDIKRRNSYLTSRYDSEFFCVDCAGDSTLIQIPFSYADKKMRKAVAKMTPQERKNFIERYKMVKAIEDDGKSSSLSNFIPTLFSIAVGIIALNIGLMALSGIKVVK